MVKVLRYSQEVFNRDGKAIEAENVSARVVRINASGSGRLFLLASGVVIDDVIPEDCDPMGKP